MHSRVRGVPFEALVMNASQAGAVTGETTFYADEFEIDVPVSAKK